MKLNREIKTIIIDKLHELPVYRSPDGIEHTVRCPYCGDSKTPTHAHLGLFIDPNEDTAMMWHCFRCGEGGRVTDDLLDDLGVNLNESDMSQLRNYNKKLAKINKKGIIRTERFIVPTSEPNYLNNEKLAYVNQRLGTQFTCATAAQVKIILSIYDFMTANEIAKFEGLESWMVKFIERDYVGFLSTNNNLLTFRNIREGGKGRRYHKIIINPLNPDNATFYSIPTRLNLMYDDEVNIHIAEGTFDILSIRYNVLHPGPNQVLYASCGYSYMGILKHLARHGIVTKVNVHIYADKDKSDYDHLEMVNKNPISKFIDHFYIHRNGYPGEKDFGVSADRIIDRVRQIW